MMEYNCTPEEIKHGYPDKMKQARKAVLDTRDTPKINGNFWVTMYGGKTVYQDKNLTNLK